MSSRAASSNKYLNANRRSRRIERTSGQMDEKTVIDRTRRWVSTIVIGLNLCPFAPRFQG